MRMPSARNYAQAPQVGVGRSQFDRSFPLKTTFDASYLVPILVDEVLPGDTFTVRMSGFARLATPIYPIMDNLHFETFFFFIPNRLLWTNWKKFCGEQVDPGDSTDYTTPQIQMPASGPAVHSLSDYFGIPTEMTNAMNVCSFWHRAYNMTWNTFFRDQNLQDSVTVDSGDGPDTYGNYVLLKRGKRHDYFTSCLPWPQKGDAVELPVGATSALVEAYAYGTSTNAMILRRASSDALAPSENVQTTTTTALLRTAADANGHYIDPNDRLYVDLSTAFATTINELRWAEQMQVLLERDARGGTRYVELIKSHFQVTCPDFRAQRPEYLGGGHSYVNVHPVATTADAGSSNPGDLSAFGTASCQGHGFVKSFVEHGVLLGLANIRADITYQQGLPRMFSRSTRYDFYWPSLAHVGEQAVLNKEIYANLADGTGSTQREGVWGYQERWAEYRTGFGKITGAFRSTYGTSLDPWHCSEEFGSQPTLDDTFITDKTGVTLDRNIQVPSEPQFKFDAFFDVKCVRPMPVFSIPTLGDRL